MECSSSHTAIHMPSCNASHSCGYVGVEYNWLLSRDVVKDPPKRDKASVRARRKNKGDWLVSSPAGGKVPHSTSICCVPELTSCRTSHSRNFTQRRHTFYVILLQHVLEYSVCSATLQSLSTQVAQVVYVCVASLLWPCQLSVRRSC